MAFGLAETMLAWRDNRLSANGDIQARRVQVVAGMTDHFALSYDGLNRLTKVAGPVAESFALDGASNITSRTGPSQTDAYDLANRLTSDGSQSFTWSNADRLTNRGADLFGYDALDRLTSSTVAGSARTYAYNGDGLLQSRTGSGASTFLWDPATSPSRELKQGSDNIVYGLGPLYVVKADTTTLTFARDGSKNVRAEVSSAGAVTAAFRYRSYGQLAQSSTSTPTYLGLASQLLDPSGLYYMRARWYDPVNARFLTRDPLNGDPASPLGLNRFAYANAQPSLLSDPTGLDPTLNDEESGGGLDVLPIGPAETESILISIWRAIVQRLPWATPAAVESERLLERGQPASSEIQVGATERVHVIAGHTPGGPEALGNGIFYADTNLLGLIRAAQQVGPVAQTYGPNFQRVVIADAPVGLNQSGLTTSVYTVITDTGGWLVTMFPGLPSR